MRGRKIAFSALLSIGALLISGCKEKAAEDHAIARPVRTVTVEPSKASTPLTFTGRIESADEAALGFRIGGRMIEQKASVGERVEGGQLLARLDPQNEMNALRSEQANLTAANARLTEARNAFDRQKTLLSQGWTTRAIHDQAEREFKTAEAQVDSAEARLQKAKDLVSFTELHADAPGIVTETGGESGEVVQAGQMIVRLARQDGRDAVFDVPAQVLRAVPADSKIVIRLANDANVSAIGRVRQVAAQADPVTRTFEVKVGLENPKTEMRLGAAVTGSVDTTDEGHIEVPATALTNDNNRPAVWLVDTEKQTVLLHNVDVAQFNPATVRISHGLEVGDVIVTAGVQALHPGQRIRILGSGN
ncbi:efflux transporter periplasmic adaptor subunit [Hyphomicrobium methylovorum]|uniref:efflux RND transporter periplasmic adaptor subunit n=1 Tax=Hyphomicrobium methylovorum TaxID=84 RepID=UPI0015E67258|nr:efflux RND transporter periplasmic adaptor subunit [Hyphomicrobium methylovorum]MBA2125420.1 efflux transporter periplasmic adaptor subunit [Hyphomicrobium methylovorum]